MLSFGKRWCTEYNHQKHAQNLWLKSFMVSTADELLVLVLKSVRTRNSRMPSCSRVHFAKLEVGDKLGCFGEMGCFGEVGVFGEVHCGVHNSLDFDVSNAKKSS